MAKCLAVRVTEHIGRRKGTSQILATGTTGAESIKKRRSLGGRYPKEAEREEALHHDRRGGAFQDEQEA